MSVLSTRILAEGEKTGHHHALDGPGELLRRTGTDQLYLRAPKPTSIGHPEHARLRLPAGIYRVVLQQEYDPDRPRRVWD
ncbi:MAG: hypothetical protein AB1758_13985 [Candidatus Eremiobacterota bacterium]